MTYEETIMAYLLKKNPDATIKDLAKAIAEINGELDRLMESWLMKREAKKCALTVNKM